MANIIITGTPGTGKTTIARILAKKINYNLIDVKDIVNQNKHLYTIEKGEKLVDLKKLRNLLLKELARSKNNIIEGHLLCDLSLPFKQIIVFRCNPRTLKKRLEKRKYKKEKIYENLLAEMLDYCLINARKNYKQKYAQIIQVEVSKRSLNATVNIILKAIKEKKKKIDDVDYSDQLKKFVVR